MDMHEASPLDIQPIQGPITRARARQLNLEVSSFLSAPINNFKNDLLPIVYNVIRNQGEDQEIHGGPLQLKFESNSGSRSCLRKNGRPGNKPSPFRRSTYGWKVNFIELPIQLV
jgi:hypothetical protein